MDIINDFAGFEVDMPTWYTVRIWLLKLGLYKLSRPKEQADDWIWIADHSIQLGAEKCLVILGIRRKDLPKDRAIILSDLEPLAVMAVTESNKKIIQQQLSEAASLTSVPYAIVSDGGPDLKSGIDAYCEENRYQCRHVYDVTHWVALQLKKYFESNEVWQQFLEFTTQAQQMYRVSGGPN